jgi:hypothetical protein
MLNLKYITSKFTIIAIIVFLSQYFIQCIWVCLRFILKLYFKSQHQMAHYFENILIHISEDLLSFKDTKLYNHILIVGNNKYDTGMASNEITF